MNYQELNEQLSWFDTIFGLSDASKFPDGNDADEEKKRGEGD